MNLIGVPLNSVATRVYQGSTHGFGTSPALMRATMYCISDDLGYVVGDEVDVNSVESDWLDANVFTSWCNSTYAGISVNNNTDLKIVSKTGSSWLSPNLNRWRFRIRVWK